MNDRELLKLALEALETYERDGKYLDVCRPSITALRAALAASVDDKPRAWIDRWGNLALHTLRDTTGATPLYTRPAAVAEPCAIEIERLKALSVTKILLDVAPGEDGMGCEVYAKSVDQVVDKLTELGQAVEDMRATRTPQPAAPPQREPKAGLLDQFLALAEANGIKSIHDLPGLIPALQATEPPQREPIDMVLHCPACGLQHIDAPEPSSQPDGMFEGDEGWDNPPHRSHLCHGCGHIWRPADVPTNGVATLKTKGKADSAAPPQRELTDADIVAIWDAMPAMRSWRCTEAQIEFARNVLAASATKETT